MIIVDFSQTMYAALFAISKGSAIEDESLVRHVIFNTLRHIKATHGNEYGRMILCMDSSNTWRKDRFPHYKAGRRKHTTDEKEAEAIQKMFEFMNEVCNDLQTTGIYPCVKVEKCEADDAVAVLTRRLKKDEPILIVSNDKDFFQLHGEGVKQYLNKFNSGKRVEFCEAPDEYLLEHIAKGDQGDGIPNVLSDDDTFVVESKRQSPMRQNRLQSIVDYYSPNSLGSEIDDSGIVTPKVKRNWDRNKKLIDLSQIPEQYVDAINEKYDKEIEKIYKPHSNRAMTLYQYFMQNDMKLLADDIQHFMIGE